MMLTFEDKNSLLNAILLPNKKFMETLVHILELYGHALSESDIEILTDREKSKRLLKQDYPVLLEVDPSKDKMEQIHKSGNYRYYANKKCMIKGKEYFYTSQLYGYGDATSHGDNRTPLWKWVCDKFDISPEEDAWWPSLQDYTPDISKEQWIALLEDPKIIGPVWGEVLAMFYTEKEGATCKFIEQKFGKKSGSVNPTCMHLAKCIQEKTSRPIIESEDNPGQKKYWPILFQGREAKKDEPGTWVWRLRSELYDALTEVNILRFLPKGGEEEMKTKDILEKIKQYIEAKGFTYKDNLVENFYLSLKSKPFVILAGTSGTGKTKLV